GYLCFKGSLTLGALIAFSSLLGQTLSPLMRASSMFFNLKSASASAERVFSIINEPSEQEGSEVSASLNGDVPAIQFENVSFGYEEDKPVLKNLNLSIKKGETVGFAGASGCGKSTILGLICGFYRPSSGRILIGGIDMGDRNLKAVRSLISYVSQDAYLFPFSIYDNIAMGKSGATKEEVIAAAKAAYAHDFIMETENGYDTIVGERGSRLSGGQIQRISIARAMLKDAPILLLDEATSALDVKAEAEVQKALDNLSIGRTVLVVAHRLSTIKGADRIAVIDNGIVAECGSHDELLKKDGLYAKLQNVHSQQGGEAL
ncbi:MAG: ABC transporter ATP-binding protein, partial [Monoglobus pectinilyticus]